MKLVPRLRDYMVKNHGAEDGWSDEQVKELVSSAIKSGDLDMTEVAAIYTLHNAEHDRKHGVKKKMSQTPNPKDFLRGDRIDVKDASAQYSDVRYAAKHYKTGLPVADERGNMAEHSSQRDKAKMGCFLKGLAARAGIYQAQMNEHERALWDEMLAKDHWIQGGDGDNTWDRTDGMRVKAVLNDSLSGGVNINPEWFDSRVVTYPLLSGELFPEVDLVPMPRGTDIETAAISTPTVTYNINEGTAVPLFDTASLIAQITGSVFPVTLAMEFGLDALQDSVVDLGGIVERLIGERYAAEADKCIAVGASASGQPTGLTNASGLGSASSASGTGGPVTLADLESLIFGLSKAYRHNQNCVFVSNDTTYARFRSLAVSGSDARRLLNESNSTQESYTALGRPWRIQNDIGNSVAFFGNLRKGYRFWRRQGLSFKWVTQDAQLARENKILLVCRTRLGGRVVDPNAIVKMADLKS